MKRNIDKREINCKQERKEGKKESTDEQVTYLWPEFEFTVVILQILV
jgi:hypothetical protein